MNHSLLIFSIIGIFASSAILIASAQEQEKDDNDISFIYAQSIVRNADGQLVSYLETFRIGIIEPQRLNNVADYELNFGEKEYVITEIEGIPHQWIKFNRPATFDSKTVRAVTSLGAVEDGQDVTFAVFTHDGYNLDAGDELTVRWTIARPVP